MRIITFNANGIRSARAKGFFSWLKQQEADLVCIQELKAQTEQLTDPDFWPTDYHCFYHPAQKKGYSGVAIYSRKKPEHILHGIGWHEIDQEGRFLEAQFGNLSIVSLYLPSGSSGETRQNLKFKLLDKLLPYLHDRLKTNRDFILCGDWNIAHKEIDLKNWRGNRKNSGFLPEERAWLDTLFANAHWIDAFRALNQEPEQYTWWSNRGQAWAKNVGWRIDYQIVSTGLKNSLLTTKIYKEQRFSDHAPLLIDYDYPF